MVLVQEVKRILVLGGSGFIGERLVEALRERGKEVTAPSREELDITADTEKLAALLIGQDALVILTQPSEEGIKNISETLALSHTPHVLYASTSLVYASSDTPVTEDSRVAPSSPYAASKYKEEEAIRLGSTPYTIARLGNVYGAPKNRGIVQKAIEALYSGRPLAVSGESQMRDFIYVDDVVTALAALLELPPENKTVNIMTGQGHTIGEMLARLEQLSGKKLIREQGAEGAPVNIVGNTDTLQTLTHMKSISLDAGLQKTLDAYDRSI